LNRTRGFTAVGVQPQRVAGPLPTECRPTRHLARGGLVSRSLWPKLLRCQRCPSPRLPGWRVTPRPRRLARMRATSGLHEEVLALERSCRHSRRGRAAQQAAAPDGGVPADNSIRSRGGPPAGEPHALGCPVHPRSDSVLLLFS